MGSCICIGYPFSLKITTTSFTIKLAYPPSFRGQIRSSEIVSDTLCDWQKSMLGMTAKITSFTVILDFKEIHANPILVQGMIRLEIDFIHKKFTQRNLYLSEFIALDVDENVLSKIEKQKFLKSKTIYKNGTNYTTRFWEGNNIPVRTEEERKLLDRLVEYDASKKSKKTR